MRALAPVRTLAHTSLTALALTGALLLVLLVGTASTLLRPVLR